MHDKLKSEVDENFDFFQRALSGLLLSHRGEFALIRHKKLVGFYPGPGEAYRAGLAEYPDELFSVQEVEDRPAELGLISLALD
jgi:hypothetical protein